MTTAQANMIQIIQQTIKYTKYETVYLFIGSCHNTTQHSIV